MKDQRYPGAEFSADSARPRVFPLAVVHCPLIACRYQALATTEHHGNHAIIDHYIYAHDTQHPPDVVR